MMITLRLRLRLCSPLGTPLTADTLFGHLCWGMAYYDGAAALTEFLAAMASPDPPLIISDPLPAGYWPAPVLPPPSAEAAALLLDEIRRKLGAGAGRVASYDRLRALLRQQYISHDAWPAIASNCDAATIARRLLVDSAAPSMLVTGTVAHNAINRLTGRPLDEGGLFFESVQYPAGHADYDVWIRTRESPERVRELFEHGLIGGYGRDGASGRGQLRVEAVEPATLPNVAGSNGVVTLGTCCPATGDPADGCWNIDVRLGKLGGAWAVTADKAAVFKHPLVLLARGACFRAEHPAPVMGRMVAGMHPERPEVVTCGYTLTLPVHLTPETFPCPSPT